MSKAALMMALGLLAAGLAHGKTGRTYYTDERVAVGRENAAQYEWAQAIRTRILETGDTIKYYVGPTYTAANDFAAQSDDFIWLLQPTTAIPRTYDVSFRTICPECGLKVKEVSVWNAWRIDPIAHPYKVQCPLCDRLYPSNNFHEGDLTSGDYPDDGGGWEHEGQRYYFLREYAHMAYGSVVVPSLRSLSQAWLLTGDPKYAHKGCILLARLATQYPNYGWSGDDAHLEDRTARTYVGPWGGRHPHYTWKQGGMVTDFIWETFCLEATAYAYDALYDYMAEDAELIPFVQAKGMPVESVGKLREYIETYLFRAAMRGLLKEKIKGNEGFHQAAALAVALVMDDYSDASPNSKDLVDYAYHGVGRSAYMLVNGLDRDGGGHESPNYSRIKFDFIRVAQLMEQVRARRPDLFPLDGYPDLFAHPKARGLFDYYIDVLVQDTFLPSIGDCGGIRTPTRYTAENRKHSFMKEGNLYAFRRYADPRYARASTRPSGEPFGGELWEPYPAEAIRVALADPASAIERRSRFLDGYGVAILESGLWPQRRAVVLNYTSIVGHRQHDPLTLSLYARGLDLLPDLGYPRTWDYRWQWDSNSLAHNTVTVNETQPVYRSFRNAASLFASVNGVHVAVAHHNPYPEGMGLGSGDAASVDLYERTVILVDVGEEQSYVVDLFAVNGGEQHDQSWHAMMVEPELPPLDWQSQETGTLAGPDVAQFAPYTDCWGRHREDGDFPCFLTGIRRATLEDPARWAWRSGLPEGDTLHLHVVPVGGPAEAIMGRGRSPAWPKDQHLDYLIVRRLAENGSPSRFLTVLDPWQEAPVVQAVRVQSERPLALEVTRADGTDEIMIHLPEGPSRTSTHRPLGIRVRSRSGEIWVRDVRIGDLGDGVGPGYAQGAIVGLDYAARQVIIEVSGASPDDFAPGRAVRIYNDLRSALFGIVEAEIHGDRICLTLDKTALMARFPVEEVQGRRLRLGVKTPFVTGHVDEETGQLTDGPNDYYHGAWLGEGEAARLVAGISNTSPPWLHLAADAGEAPPAGDYVGNTVSLWHYGVGDRAEVARIGRRSSVTVPGS